MALEYLDQVQPAGGRRGGRVAGPNHSLRKKLAEILRTTGRALSKDARTVMLEMITAFVAKVMDLEVRRGGEEGGSGNRYYIYNVCMPVVCVCVRGRIRSCRLTERPS